MNMLILTADQRAAIEALNASGSPDRELAPVTLPDGRSALNADLLHDSAPGQTWAHYHAALAALPIEDVPVPEQTAVK